MTLMEDLSFKTSLGKDRETISRHNLGLNDDFLERTLVARETIPKIAK